MLKHSCPLKGIRPFVEGMCVAAEDQENGSLETAPAHGSPTENIWFALPAMNSFMCVFPRNFLPARANTGIIIYSVLSYQKLCFAPHFFQPNGRPWASFFVTSLFHRGTWNASTRKYHCGLSQFLLADAGCCQHLQLRTVLQGLSSHTLTRDRLNL